MRPKVRLAFEPPAQKYSKSNTQTPWLWELSKTMVMKRRLVFHASPAFGEASRCSDSPNFFAAFSPTPRLINWASKQCSEGLGGDDSSTLDES